VTSSDESFSYRSLGGQRGTDGGFVVLPWPRTVDEWQAGPQAEEGRAERHRTLAQRRRKHPVTCEHVTDRVCNTPCYENLNYLH
jgi:hypothetical protein